jgi:hypothetical protein
MSTLSRIGLLVPASICWGVLRLLDDGSNTLWLRHIHSVAASTSTAVKPACWTSCAESLAGPNCGLVNWGSLELIERCESLSFVMGFG